jgi:hypothetical protein
MRKEGWYSGDIRCHYLTPQAALLEGAAEDLAFVNLLACETEIQGHEPLPAVGDLPEGKQRTYTAIPNLVAFSGQKFIVQIPGQTMVVVNTHNRHPVLGSLGLLNCHRIVFPLRFGGPNGLDNWTLSDWCDQCHRKGGLVVWTDRLEEQPNHYFGEALANLILGKVDAIERPFSQNNWHGFLNCGFRVPLVGGSGKESNRTALGSFRTYARLLPDEEVSYKNWIEAIRAGRTFVTTGPLLTLSVEGLDPGGVLDVPPNGSSVRVRAQVRSPTPVEWLEVVANGKVVATTQEAGPSAEPTLEADVPMPTSGWLAARCWGQLNHVRQIRVLAQTSPVYIQVAGRPHSPNPDLLAGLISRLDKTLTWIRFETRCENDQQRERLSNVINAARQELIRLATS